MTFALAHGDAEVHQYRTGVRHHHIGRLDVAVHDAGGMHRLHRVDEFAREAFQVIAHIAAIDTHVLAQIPALDKFGDDERQRIVQLHVHDAADSGMAHLLQCHGLAAQPFPGGELVIAFRSGFVILGQRIAQNLHRILVPAVVADAPYRSHGPGSEAGDQRIAAYEVAFLQIQCA